MTTSFVQRTKRGPVDAKLRVGHIEFQEQSMKALLNIDSLCYFTDNHLPRKNVGKPKRGFFDAGHLDVVAKMNVRIDEISADTLVAAVTHLQGIDRGSGLNVTDLNFRVGANKEGAHLRNVSVKLPNTTLKFDDAVIVFPNKKTGKKLIYSTSLISGKVKLKDISKPFSIVLSHFEMPLYLQTWMSGGADGMSFRHVKVYTGDKKLEIKADGRITGLKNKFDLLVHFDIHNMTTSGKKAEEVINQFVVKKFMMKQLNALGKLQFKGNFDVKWKREIFSGDLMTTAGDINFKFELDELNKYVFGTAQSKSLHLGKVMDMRDIGKIAAKANFKFDISKPRTALMRKQKGGKLPIGHVDAYVDEATFKGVKVTKVAVVMDSDGAVAEGSLNMPGRLLDMSCTFSFTNTNEMQKTKIKPRIGFHKKSEDEKLAKEQEKLKKQQEKEARRVEKAAAKAEKKAAKERRRDSIAAVKAATKAAKAAAKAERKAAKAAAKAAKDSE